MDKWLGKINKLAAWQVAIIIVVVGVAVFFTGLTNPFQNDDTFQIVTNTPVHSITNLPQFFQGGTFFDGQTLTGSYYRPLMSTTFSLIYSVFGPRPVAFHIVQLALYLAGSFMLYLVLKHFLKKTTRVLPLVLIFLVHPLNTQVVYSIPTMQDVLFFFFGMLGLWLLITYKSQRSLWGVTACLILALLSKEVAIVFTILAFLYLYLFDKERMRALGSTLVWPAIAYLLLRINAVGLIHTQRAAPIDDLNLLERLFTAPSVALFYVTKFLFPKESALGYYWTHPTFSFLHVLLPLLVDLAIIGLFIYIGFRVRAKLSKDIFRAYVFFASWTALGIAFYLPVLRLDFTACESWFYFTMAGLLGTIGVALLLVKIRTSHLWVLIPVLLLLVGVLGVRSATRGFDYQSQYKLALHDISISPHNYSALNNISQEYIHRRKYKQAATYAQRSIDEYPVVSNYNNLGVALQQSGDYPGAVHAYSNALHYNDLSIVYENLGLILMVYSDPKTSGDFLQKGLKVYPHDYRLWVYLAILEGAQGHRDQAKSAITTATKYGSVPPYIYGNIMNGRPFTLPLLGKTLLVKP